MTLDRYVQEFAARRSERTGEPAWLAAERQRAFDRFMSLGFPTTRDEEWRFTNVSPIAEASFVAADGPTEPADVTPFRLQDRAAAELVFVDGTYVPALSTTAAPPSSVRVDSLKSVLPHRSGEIQPFLGRQAQPDRRAFAALNTAFLTDGAYVRIPAGVVLDAPVHLLFVSTGTRDGRPLMTHPRVLLVAGDSSQSTVVESYIGVGTGPYLTNGVTEIVVGENAVLNHYRLQHEAVPGFHVGSTFANVRSGSVFSSHSVNLGGSIVRNDTTAVLDGEGAECTLNGLYFAAGERLIDNHTTIDHARPHCGSREMYKGVLAGHARGVFNGKIIVRPDAQKTDARQTNRALLLSEHAQINTKPELEIFANDVKCTHGAAVGQLDEEALFYLRSRGLDSAEARALLIRAFLDDVLHRVQLESIRMRVEHLLHRQLAEVLPAAA
jgi:Fe-S cluster assembly protein SufD